MNESNRNTKSLPQDFKEKWQWVQTVVQNNPLVTLLTIVMVLIVAFFVWKVIFEFNSPLIRELGFNQSLWAWMDLLIIPVALAVAAYALSKLQKESEQRVAERREEENRQLAERREEENRRRDDEKQSRDTYQSFVDFVEKFFHNHKGQLQIFEEDHPIRSIVQARTTHTLTILNETWRPLYFQFLLVSGLTTGGRQKENATGDESSSLDNKTIYAGILRNADLRLINLDKVDLFSADLQRVNLERCKLHETVLINVDLSDAKLKDAQLIGVQLTNGILLQAQMEGVNLENCVLKKANLSKSNLSKSKIKSCAFGGDKEDEGSNLSGALLEEVELRHVEFQHATLKEAKFLNSDLEYVNFRGAKLHNATFNHSKLVDVDFFGAELSGVYINNTQMDERTLQTLPNEWRVAWGVLNNPSVNRELSGVNLAGIRLEEAIFEQANLESANFRNADLRNASFVGANLQRADFGGANLTGVVLRNADLRWVNWYQTILDPESLFSKQEPNGLDRKNRRVWEIVNNQPVPTDDALDLLGASVATRRTDDNFSARDEISLNLSGKDLSEANFNGANLANANLRKTNLRSSDLLGAILNNADLTRAYLKDAQIPDDLIQYVFSLRGATMPDGSFSPVNEKLLENALEIIQSNLQPGFVTHNDLVVVQRYETEKSKLAVYLISEVQPDDADDDSQIIDLPKLAQEIEARFNESEIQDLCFKLQVDYENVPGNNKADKARELVLYFDRRAQITELIEMLISLRSAVEWRPRPKSQKSVSIVSKMDIAVVVDVARPTAGAVARYLDSQQVDANFVLFQHIQSGSFLSVDDDWEQLTKTFSEVMKYVKQEFPNQRIRFFLAGPVSLIFAMGSIWGTVDEAIVYHYENNTYHPVINISRELR